MYAGMVEFSNAPSVFRRCLCFLFVFLYYIRIDKSSDLTTLCAIGDVLEFFVSVVLRSPCVTYTKKAPWTRLFDLFPSHLLFPCYVCRPRPPLPLRLSSIDSSVRSLSSSPRRSCRHRRAEVSKNRGVVNIRDVEEQTSRTWLID